jgi:hypothetical protein
MGCPYKISLLGFGKCYFVKYNLCVNKFWNILKGSTSRCPMSSAEHVTSGFTTAVETNSNSSGRSVLTANDAAAKAVERERSGHNARYRVCNCSAHGVRPKGRSIKCPARGRVDGIKGPNAKTQGNEDTVQVRLDGLTEAEYRRAIQYWSPHYCRTRVRW